MGATGSIGTQALEVIRRHCDRFEVVALTANHNDKLLTEQAMEFLPSHVVIADEQRYTLLKEALEGLPVTVMAGRPALNEVVALPEVDIVLTAMVGFSGLAPTYAALEHGRNVALANKETLVAGGALITRVARERGADIYPVDSEHSAIFQCLAGESPAAVEKIILTASGGPFRGMTREQLEKVTCSQALRHPNWCMGNKVTIDSASLMNKGLEVIEAGWLFNKGPDDIEVVIHPQSIIHSLVQFTDGSIKAQLGLPDMKLPIQYALGWPERLHSDFPRFSFAEARELTFEKPDLQLFRNLSIAYGAMRKGGNMPCIMNAANEVVVEAFLDSRVGFMDMPGIVEEVMGRVGFSAEPGMEMLEYSDAEARRVAESVVKKRS